MTHEHEDAMACLSHLVTLAVSGDLIEEVRRNPAKTVRCIAEVIIAAVALLAPEPDVIGAEDDAAAVEFRDQCCQLSGALGVPMQAGAGIDNKFVWLILSKLLDLVLQWINDQQSD